MDKPALLTSLMFLAGSGCVLPHSLGAGDSAQDGGGDGSGAGSTGGDAGGLSQSDTGTPGVGTSSEEGDTAVATEEGDGSDGSEVTGAEGSSDGPPADECVALGESFVISFPLSDLQRPNESWNSHAALAGPCDVVFIDSDPLDPSIKGFALDCSLDGLTDSVEVTDLALQPFIGASGDLVQEGLTARLEEGTVVNFRLAQVNWGMNFYTWMVVEDQAGGLLFDAFSAADPDPASQEVISDAVSAIMGGEPWHRALEIAVVDTECQQYADELCLGVQEALELAWDGGEPTVVQAASSTFVDEAGPQSIFVHEALDYTNATCDDIPVKVLRYTSYRP